MRTILFSLGAAAALGAAVIWTPLPSSNQDGAASKTARSPAPALVAPGDITASHAAALVQFGPEEAGAAARPAPPVLVGLIRSGPRRIAYVLFAGQTTRAGLWDKVGPWRVTGIGPRGVTLQGGGKPLALALYGPRPAPAPEPAGNAEATAAAPTATAPSPPPAHALEPASAPQPRPPAGKHPRYWAGPPGSAPPGFILLKPGERPPN